MYRFLFFYANMIVNKNEVLNKVKLKVKLTIWIFGRHFGEGSISLVFVYPWNNNSHFEKNRSFSIIPEAPVVQRLGSAIHWINCYPVDKC